MSARDASARSPVTPDEGTIVMSVSLPLVEDRSLIEIEGAGESKVASTGAAISLISDKNVHFLVDDERTFLASGK